VRTVEREVRHLRRELAAEARATIRFETPPGRQLQIVHCGGRPLGRQLQIVHCGGRPLGRQLQIVHCGGRPLGKSVKNSAQIQPRNLNQISGRIALSAIRASP
jgi:chorismate-pyruvate lyase